MVDDDDVACNDDGDDGVDDGDDVYEDDDDDYDDDALLRLALLCFAFLALLENPNQTKNQPKMGSKINKKSSQNRSQIGKKSLKPLVFVGQNEDACFCAIMT